MSLIHSIILFSLWTLIAYLAGMVRDARETRRILKEKMALCLNRGDAVSYEVLKEVNYQITKTTFN